MNAPPTITPTSTTSTTSDSVSGSESAPQEQGKQQQEQGGDQGTKQRSIADIIGAACESNNVAPLVVYTGDAAGCLDPLLLAQGAGLAVESGFHLAQSIQEARKMHAAAETLRGGTGEGGVGGYRSQAGGGADTVMNIDNMKLHLLDFESTRSRRFRNLQLIGGLSNSVSHLESEVCHI